MKIKFTNFYKATSLYSSKIHTIINSKIFELIKKNKFVGSSEVQKFEKDFARFTKVNYCVSLANGTDAIEIAIESLNLKKKGEIIVPVNTWISSAEAISRSGYKVVFCDINLNDYSISIEDLKKKISKRTVAVIVVHLYGYPADMKKIKLISKKNKIKIIEDCAQAAGTMYRGKHVGTLGDIGTFSFFPGKNLGAYGDGGAIITNNYKYYNFARRVKNHGALNKYDHKFEGRNSRLDSLNAAVLSIKLKYYKKKLKKRNKLAQVYFKNLFNLEKLSLPSLDFKNNFNSFHQFVIRLKKRDSLKFFLKKNNIDTMIHYPYMLNELKFYKKKIKYSNFVNSKNLGRKILSLPISEEHTVKEIKYISKKIQEFFKKK